MSDQYLGFLDKLKPHPSKNPATWKDVVAVTPCRSPVQIPNTYIATIYPDWSFAEFALGGVLYALSLEAAKKHVKITLPKLDLPDAVSSSINFFKPAATGKVMIKIEDLNIGGQYSNFRVVIYQHNNKTKTQHQCTECQVTLGNLNKEASRPGQLNMSGPAHPLYNEKAKQKPSREGWVETPIQKKIPGFWGTKDGTRMLYPPGSVLNNKDGALPHPEFGTLVGEHWWRGPDPWTSSHLPFYIDVQPPLHSKFPQGYTYWGPTLSMSMDQFKRPAVTRSEDGKKDGSEWLWTRLELVASKGGRYLGDFTVKDEEGDMVAIGRIVNLAVPYQAFNKGKGDKQKKNVETKSKI